MELLARLRQPAYTGANRCWQCTGLNLVLLAAVVTVLAVAGRPFAGVAVAAVGGTAIWLRGYLLPFAPRFAPTLAGPTLGTPGDDERRVTDSLVDGIDDGEAVVESLREAGVLVGGRDLELSTGYREGWREEMIELTKLDDGGFAQEVATVAPGAERARVVTEDGRTFVVTETRDGEKLWVTRPVAVAEVAALRTLPDTMPPDHRVAAARSLRLFLERCPECGGRADTSTTAAVWGSTTPPDEHPDEVLVCWDCGERLYTY